MSETVRLFADAWKVMVGRLPSPHIEEADGVVSCFGNVPLIFLNISIVARPAATDDDLRGLLNTAAGHRASCEHPAGVLLRQDWMPPGWENVIKDAGLAPVLPMTGMEGDGLLSPRRPQPALEIRRVVDDVTARDLAEVNAHAYHMPPEGFDCIANMRLWHPDSCGYVGYVDGAPVSAAAAFPVAGTVYVALVATLPAAQGRGYAETVMRQAVTHGQQTMATTRTTLHASDMGMPVYRAMGYRPGARLIFAAPA